MANALTRWWKYLGAKANTSLDERADPKVQLEQAIREAQDQHRRLKEQAANVIANQKQTEMRLNRALDEYEKLTANARQAVVMADEATKSGDQDKAVEYTQAAEAFANRLIAVEREVEDLKTLVLQPPRPPSRPSRRWPRTPLHCRRSWPSGRSSSASSTRPRCRSR